MFFLGAQGEKLLLEKEVIYFFSNFYEQFLKVVSAKKHAESWFAS